MGRSGNPAKRALQDAALARARAKEAASLIRATFYCDESGYTGANWADADQPVFVHGGWLVVNSARGGILDEMLALRERFGLIGGELKWAKVARRRNSSAIYRNLFELMLKHGALPFFFVMDKDFLLAAKTVETFFDPAYNRHLDPGFTGAYEEKKQLAEELLPAKEILAEFATMHREGVVPPRERVGALAEMIAEWFELGGTQWVAETQRDYSDHELDDLRSEFGATNSMRSTTGHSLPGLMQLLEGFMRPRAIALRILHDNLTRFDDLIEFVQRLLRPPGPMDSMKLGNGSFYFSMPTVTGFDLVDSKSEPLVQLADLLCGFVRTVFTKVKNGEELDDDELAICSDIAMVHVEYYCWDANMPEAMWESFATQGWAELRRRFGS
ncbi:MULTISPECIES: DUF3800 domain-containing protein [Mumia]|nr:MULTISPECIES: DUF3800 domain-containing protein [Mumia]